MRETRHCINTLFLRGDYETVTTLPIEVPADLLIVSRAYERLDAFDDALTLLEKLESGQASFVAACKLERAFIDLKRNRDPGAVLNCLKEVMDKGYIDDSLRVRGLTARGIAENRLAASERAKHSLLEAIDLSSNTHNLFARATALDALGTVFSWNGDLEYAELHFTQALADWAALDNHIEAAREMANLGRVNLEARRFRYARNFLERAVELLPRSCLREHVRLNHNLGVALTGLEEFAKAQDCYDEAQRGAATLKDDYLAFIALRDSATAFARNSEHKSAWRQLQSARAYLPGGENSYDRLSFALAEGEIQLISDNPLAVDTLKDVAAAFADRNLTGFEVIARCLYSQALVKWGEPPMAERELLYALQKARNRNLRQHAMEVMEIMGRLDIAEGMLESENRPVVKTINEGIRSNGYVIRQRLGSGTFGTVYRVFDIEQARELALKELNLDRTYSLEARERLLKSARAELETASRVQHPGVAQVFAINQSQEELIYIAQEYIPGSNLRDLMTRETAPPAHRVMPVLMRILHSLNALHHAGVVHRDLKPENILMRNGDEPVLVDFGIAQSLDQYQDGLRITGTLPYMAPEQLAGKQVDHRTDLYAWGVIAYEWLTGETPYDLTGLTPVEALARIRKTRAPNLARKRPDLSSALVSAITHSLNKARWMRPDTAARQIETLQTVYFDD